MTYLQLSSCMQWNASEKQLSGGDYRVAKTSACCPSCWVWTSSEPARRFRTGSCWSHSAPCWLTDAAKNNATMLNGAAWRSLSPQQTISDHFLNVQHSNVTSTKPFFQYLLQAESNSSCPIGDLWRHAVSCGHYDATMWQPLPAMQLWRWRTARSGKREPMLTTSRSDFLCRLHAMPGIQPTVSNHWKHCHNWSKSLLTCQITSASFIMNYLPALRSSETINRHSVDIHEGRTKSRPRIYL